MTLSNDKHIVLEEIHVCPHCGSDEDALYLIHEEERIIRGSNGELTARIRELLCLNCKLHIVEVSSNDTIVDMQCGAPSRFGT